MEKVRISNRQLGLLAFGFLYGNNAIANPVLGAKRDAWLALIIGWIFGLILITMFLYISKLNKEKNLVGILDSCFGKVFGKVICLLYIFHFLHIAALNVRGFGEFMSIVTYPETPLSVLMGVLMLFIVYVARSGLETAGRLSEIFVPIIPISIIFIALSITALPNYSGFEPMLLEIAPVIKAAATSVTIVFGDLVVFLMVLPYTNSEKGRFKAIYIAFAAIGVLIMIVTVRDILLIGPVLTENFAYPAHVAAQMLRVLNIDPVVDLNILLGCGFKAVIYLYAATKATAELFKFDNYKPLVCAFGVFVFTVAFWTFPNSAESARWLKSMSVIIYCFPFQTFFPVLMLIISIVNQSKEAKVEA